MNIVEFISLWWKEVLEYKERVLKDGGTTKREDNVQRYYQMCKEQGILNSIKFAWLGEAGGKFRTSGANQFWTKAYSLVTTNDATQTTSTSQPHLGNTIAPNERPSFKNQNGQSNFLTHPTISFAANEAWSVTTVLNWNGSSVSNYYAGSTSGGLFIYQSTYGYKYGINIEGTLFFSETSNTKKIIGKN